jgi:uncharacterized membrane protein
MQGIIVFEEFILNAALALVLTVIAHLAFRNSRRPDKAMFYAGITLLALFAVSVVIPYYYLDIDNARKNCEQVGWLNCGLEEKLPAILTKTPLAVFSYILPGISPGVIASGLLMINQSFRKSEGRIRLISIHNALSVLAILFACWVSQNLIKFIALSEILE